MSRCRWKTIYRKVIKLCRNDVQTVHCRISVVISVSDVTCHWVLVLLRRRRVETQASVCIIVTINMGLDEVSRALLVKLFFEWRSHIASSILSHGNSNFNNFWLNWPSASPVAIPKSPVNSNLRTMFFNSGTVVVVDWGFTTLLTSQVISVAFYSERVKDDKFGLQALISAWGTNGFTSLPKEVILRIFSLWKIPSTTAGFGLANLGSCGEYDNHGNDSGTEREPLCIPFDTREEQQHYCCCCFDKTALRVKPCYPSPDPC